VSRQPIFITTLGDLVAQSAERWSHNALVTQRQRATYPQLDLLVDEYARAFLALGVQRNDKIGILMSQDLDYLVALLAVVRIGGVAVPVNARFKSTELRHVIESSDMSVLLLSAGSDAHVNYASLLTEAFPLLETFSSVGQHLPTAPRLRRIVLFDSPPTNWSMSPTEFLELGKVVRESDVKWRSRGVAVRDTALMLYTSGTTSSPKGALLSHEAFMRCALALGGNIFGLSPADTTWCPMPMFHVGGIAFMVTALMHGATYVHAGNFTPTVSARQLRDEKVSVAWPAFDMLWQDVLNEPDFDAETAARIRVVLMSVGLPSRVRELQNRLPNAKQVAGFGATESAGLLTMGEPSDPIEVRLESMGRPLDGMEVRLLDPVTGERAAEGEPGEICYRGPSCFSGYYVNHEVTKSAFDSDGFFHSGDLGQLVYGGRLRFISRIKDMLKVGGENVAAVEIEDHLQSHPLVRTAQVVAAPDARYHEVPAAFVLLRAGATCTEKELIDHCRGKIATFKVPRYVRFVNEFPMSGTKIKKNVLREMIAQELSELGATSAPKVTSK
jgi:fatty-acyl-CoA synthase